MINEKQEKNEHEETKMKIEEVDMTVEGNETETVVQKHLQNFAIFGVIFCTLRWPVTTKC